MCEGAWTGVSVVLREGRGVREKTALVRVQPTCQHAVAQCQEAPQEPHVASNGC